MPIMTQQQSILYVLGWEIGGALPQHALTDGRRLYQLKSILLGRPLKDCLSVLMSFCKVTIVMVMCQGANYKECSLRDSLYVLIELIELNTPLWQTDCIVVSMDS